MLGGGYGEQRVATSRVGRGFTPRALHTPLFSSTPDGKLQPGGNDSQRRSPASPRRHAIAHLHQEKVAPLHHRTVELEHLLTTDELAAQAAFVNCRSTRDGAGARARGRDAVQHELDMERARASALEVKSNRLEEENKLLLEHVSVTRGAAGGRGGEAALKAERETRAEAERATTTG